MNALRGLCLLAGCASLSLAAASSSGCGPAPAPAPPPEPTAAPSAAPSAAPVASAAPTATASAAPAAFDPCAGSKPVPHPYQGILRVAKCDQDMFLTMASVAGQLGVECAHCHVPSKSDPKKEDYPVMTSKKEVANWMSMHLMQAVKPADGSPMKCKSCHTDDHGKPVAKIFGEPRDVVKAHEWMSLVMVQKFVSASGEKLKCKSCHVGTFSTPEWHARVILQTAQIPKHEVGGPAGPAL